MLWDKEFTAQLWNDLQTGLIAIGNVSLALIVGITLPLHFIVWLAVPRYAKFINAELGNDWYFRTMSLYTFLTVVLTITFLVSTSLGE